MKTKDMKSAALIVVAVIATAAIAEKQPIERYQSIIDRQMFGPLPNDFDPTKMPSEVSKSGSAASEQELTKEQEQLQSAIHFSVINVDQAGKAIVGFSDNSDPKAPKHHYMRVGETQDGWEVKEADPEHATMTVVKDGVEVSLTLGDNSGKGGGKTSSSSKGESAKTGLQGGFAGSLRARRAARKQAEREEEQKRAAEAAEREAARQAQVEQEKAEREAERAQQQQQLQALADELRKAREERKKQSESENANHDVE